MASVLELITHYQQIIEKNPDDRESVLKCLEMLFNLEVTVEHLDETGVGFVVSGLRNEPGDVGRAARALVYKWKLMVARDENEVNQKNDSGMTL